MSREVDEDLRDHGPEWWAMGREYCTCEHHYDAHLIQSPRPGEFVKGACIAPSCDCREFRPLDNQ